MNKEQKFYSALKDLFIGAKLEGQSGYVNLMNIKSEYFDMIEKELKKEINDKFKCNELDYLFDKLNTFFENYFGEGGSIFFSSTPLYKNIYAKVYSDREDVALFWKTSNLYYVKSEPNYTTVNNLKLKDDGKYSFNFDASELEHKKGNEKKELTFYFVGFDEENKALNFKVKYKETIKYDGLKEILGLKKTDEVRKYLSENIMSLDHEQIKVISNGLDLEYINFKGKTKSKALGSFIVKELKDKLVKTVEIEPVITDVKEIEKYLIKKYDEFIDHKTIEKAFSVYKKQTEIDYFIHKDAEGFLKEQFKLYIYQHLTEFNNKDNFDTIFNQESLDLIKRVRDIGYKTIEYIGKFENELKKIWEKPKFVLNSNYVITLDRIYNKNGIDVIESIFNDDEGIREQINEWKTLGFIEDDFKLDDIFVNNGKELNPKYKFLPIDTKYFDEEIKFKILNLFDDLDNELDGWLIKSDNWQALNTIKDKFREKIQTIYIDPPFNLGKNADFYYNVNYKDSTWITILENRLSLAKDLLNEKGSIFVRCDYNGNAYVKLLMNDIFGEDNFRNEIVINRKRQSIGTPNKFEVESEYLYYYSKSENYYRKDLYKSRNLADFKWTGFLKQGHRNPPERIFFGKVLYPPKGQHFSLVQEKVDKLLKEHFLRLKCKKCGTIYYWDDEESKENFINKILKNKKDRFKYLDIKPDSIIYGVKKLDKCLNCGGDYWKVEYLTSDKVKITDNWKDIPSYSDNYKFPTENSEQLLRRVILSTSNENDLIMDFFCGSGTTIATAHKLKRKWIGVEMGEHFYTVIIPRMKKVLFYDKSGISKEKDVKENYNKNNAGGFFKYYELEQYEDTLRKAVYNPLPEKLENIDFALNEKLAKDGLKIDYENEKAIYTFNKLYDNIDLAETISNITGWNIKKITKDKIIYENRTSKKEEIIDLNNLTFEKYPFLKPLIWWE